MEDGNGRGRMEDGGKEEGRGRMEDGGKEERRREEGERRREKGRMEEGTGNCIVLNLVKLGDTGIFWRVSLSKGMP
jgi:hypothetical protein